MAHPQLFEGVSHHPEPRLIRRKPVIPPDVLQQSRKQLLDEVAEWLTDIGLIVTRSQDYRTVGVIRDLRVDIIIQSPTEYTSFVMQTRAVRRVRLDVCEYSDLFKVADMRTVRELAADPVKWHKKADAREIARLHFRLTGQKLRQKAVK